MSAMTPAVVEALTDVLMEMTIKATERAYMEHATNIGDTRFHPLQPSEAAEIAVMASGAVNLCMFAALCEAAGLDPLAVIKRAQAMH